MSVPFWKPSDYHRDEYDDDDFYRNAASSIYGYLDRESQGRRGKGGDGEGNGQGKGSGNGESESDSDDGGEGEGKGKGNGSGEGKGKDSRGEDKKPYRYYSAGLHGAYWANYKFTDRINPFKDIKIWRPFKSSRLTSAVFQQGIALSALQKSSDALSSGINRELNKYYSFVRLGKSKYCASYLPKRLKDWEQQSVLSEYVAQSVRHTMDVPSAREYGYRSGKYINNKTLGQNAIALTRLEMFGRNTLPQKRSMCVVFILDQSGSMSEELVESAHKAIMASMRGLESIGIDTAFASYGVWSNKDEYESATKVTLNSFDTVRGGDLFFATADRGNATNGSADLYWQKFPDEKSDDRDVFLSRFIDGGHGGTPFFQAMNGAFPYFKKLTEEYDHTCLIHLTDGDPSMSLSQLSPHGQVENTIFQHSYSKFIPDDQVGVRTSGWATSPNHATQLGIMRQLKMDGMRMGTVFMIPDSDWLNQIESDFANQPLVHAMKFGCPVVYAQHPNACVQLMVNIINEALSE